MVRRLWNKIVLILYRIGADPEDSNKLRLQKAIMVGASFLGTTFGVIWIPIYVLDGNIFGALSTFAWAVLIIINLIIFSRTRAYPRFRSVLLLSIIIVPFIQALTERGLISSGAGVLWSFIAPLLALTSTELREATRWYYGFIIVVIISGLVESVVQDPNFIPGPDTTGFFVLNILAIAFMAFLILYYFVRERDLAYSLLSEEQARSESLLLNILPSEIADILKKDTKTIAEHYEEASILFADIVGFTPLTNRLSPTTMVELLNTIYSQFDFLVEKYGVEKIRTIGDNYMVASGVPTARIDHGQALANLALDMLEYCKTIPSIEGQKVQFRIGMNTGSLVAGVIGRKKFQYDIWGDAVNIASRMESHGAPGKIQVTEEVYFRLREAFKFEPRGSHEIKGKGELNTWFLISRRF